MYVGTIGLVHGLETLIDSLADERIRALPIDFAILGDGQFAGRCSEKVARYGLTNVWVLPSIPLEQVGYALRQADVLMCSYRNEDYVPLGSKFYEYCASGRPILVHGTNAAGELVSRIGNGIACQAGNVPELEAALKDFVSRPEHWKEAGERGRLYAFEHFSQNMRDRQWDELITGSQPTGENGRDHELSASTS
jgi:glycosyltransferase involved in cell wall biosynthesis